ncbi:uncharacterized protein F13E9.13, mitochondrial-like isoform X4 [Malaclemys terrapin pileata]|uniref:uncharacterized protein F13E9.13, mitochondrial-like isoform X4 n=1 Tax=Malaclemys terrapin pileata TaxID=2991368 RepID=UPI0023A8EED4|nr:uncharacterized protein F13E9.13, mitochondrial-like isoform X4 [Malaclemys terrapin pileata]
MRLRFTKMLEFCCMDMARNDGWSLSGTCTLARREIFDGLIVENMHDLPYTVSVGPEITAAMAVISAAVKHTCPRLPLGIQILCSANQQAVAVALAAGLDFIRVEGFVFSHVADEGMINACAGDLLRYRKQIGAQHVQIFADIKKKHSAHALTADVSISETAKAAEFFLADGIVLTGTATGMQADPKELKEVEHAVKIPVLIGSGVTLENARSYLDANALIIGSYFKKEGYWANSVDPDRVKKFMDHIDSLGWKCFYFMNYLMEKKQSNVNKNDKF